MLIEELYKLIEEIENEKKEYENKPKNKKIAKKKELINIKKLLIALGLPLSLVGLINLYLFLEKEINNPYQNNNLKITEAKAIKIKSKIEEELNINIDNNQLEEYALLNALLSNKKLTQEQRITISNNLIQIIEDNPYIDKEYAYNALSNLTIKYQERPTDVQEVILAQYEHGEIMNYSYNNILVYNTDYENVIEHELIHSLLVNLPNDKFPTFIIEGITELINDEYFSQNPYIEYECYPYEILVIKMLCEITREDTVLESYTKGNINILYKELLKIDKNTSPKEFINMIESLLDDYKENNTISVEKAKAIHKQLTRYFIRAKHQNSEKDFKVFANYLNLFDTIMDEESYTLYLKQIEKKGYIYRTYFNKNLVNCIPSPKKVLKK